MEIDGPARPGIPVGVENPAVEAEQRERSEDGSENTGRENPPDPSEEVSAIGRVVGCARFFGVLQP